MPEAEIIKRVIEPQIQGPMIDKVNVKRPEVVAYPAADEFCRLLTGQIIFHMTRRGKFLAIRSGSNDCIILHLRMTGCLLITPADCPEEKHTHIIFSLNNGKESRFSDTRRFGRFWLLRKDEADTYSGIAKLGVKPLDKLLTAGYLNACLGKRKKAVKECLLDQSIIAGIGSIYSDEILFTAGIYPANSLTMELTGLKSGMYPFAPPPFFFKFREAATLQHDCSSLIFYHILSFVTIEIVKNGK